MSQCYIFRLHGRLRYLYLGLSVRPNLYLGQLVPPNSNFVSILLFQTMIPLTKPLKTTQMQYTMTTSSNHKFTVRTLDPLFLHCSQILPTTYCSQTYSGIIRPFLSRGRSATFTPNVLYTTEIHHSIPCCIIVDADDLLENLTVVANGKLYCSETRLSFQATMLTWNPMSHHSRNSLQRKGGLWPLIFLFKHPVVILILSW